MDIAALIDAGLKTLLNELRGEYSFNRLSEAAYGDRRLAPTLQRMAAPSEPIDRAPECRSLTGAAECLRAVQPLRVTSGDLYIAAGCSMEHAGLLEGIRRRPGDESTASVLGSSIATLDIGRLSTLKRVGDGLAGDQAADVRIAELRARITELETELAAQPPRPRSRRS